MAQAYLTRDYRCHYFSPHPPSKAPHLGGLQEAWGWRRAPGGGGWSCDPGPHPHCSLGWKGQWMGSPPMALPAVPGNSALAQLQQGLAPGLTPPLAALCLWETENIPQREGSTGKGPGELSKPGKEQGVSINKVYLPPLPWLGSSLGAPLIPDPWLSVALCLFLCSCAPSYHLPPLFKGSRPTRQQSGMIKTKSPAFVQWKRGVGGGVHWRTACLSTGHSLTLPSLPSAFHSPPALPLTTSPLSVRLRNDSLRFLCLLKPLSSSALPGEPGIMLVCNQEKSQGPWVHPA